MQTELFLFNEINSALHKTLKWESLWTDLLLLYFLFPFPLLLVAQHQAINISKTKHHKVYSRKLLKIRQRNQKSPPSWASQIQEPLLITVMKNGLTLWITISLTTTFIPIVGLLTGGSQTQANRLEIEFKDETVRKWTFSENNSKMKTGLIQ